MSWVSKSETCHKEVQEFKENKLSYRGKMNSNSNELQNNVVVSKNSGESQYSKEEGTTSETNHNKFWYHFDDNSNKNVKSKHIKTADTTTNQVDDSKTEKVSKIQSDKRNNLEHDDNNIYVKQKDLKS